MLVIDRSLKGIVELMWSNIATLQKLSKFASYIFIVLGFIIAICGQFARTKIDDRVKYLQKQINDQQQAELQNKLDASHRKVDELENQIISATASVEAFLSWDVLENIDEWKAVLEGNVSYVAFGRDTDALLIIRSQIVVGSSKTKGFVTLSANCDLSAPESQVNCDFQQLSETTFIQIGLPDLVPEETLVSSGTVHLTINGNKKLSFALTSQRVNDHKIVIPNVEAQWNL
jgi:hypothetical protein